MIFTLEKYLSLEKYVKSSKYCAKWHELKVKVVFTLLTISKFANLGQEIQRVWRHCNFNAFSFFSGI